MTQGKEKKKTRMKGDKQENRTACGSAELPQTAEGRDKIKLVSSSEEDNRTTLQDLPLHDELPGSNNDFPTLFSLIVQRHEGETCGGQFHGEGVAWFEGGHMYKGMFAKGLMDGRGVFTHASGLKYEGEFVCNMPMGHGTYTWLDGSSYKGEVYNGIRHGTGTYICAKSGVSYKGEWERGKRHGKGAVYYNQDQTSWYKGDWVKNNREGQGVRCYPSGNIYSGEWKSNLRHGEGTMRWLKLGQQYDGMWQNGVQHGRGTHVWILRRVDGSQYSQSNQYTGDYVQGQRHGQGAFYYAAGEIYEGEWKNNKKHGKDGRVFEGEFVDDRMMTQSLDGNRTPVHLCDSDSSILGPDMALNIEYLLDMIPERERDTEHKQVEFVVLMHGVELRSVYSFYSRLGHAHSPNNVFLLTRLQLWRLLKDCNIHHHDITLTQIDHFIREDAAPAEIHSPFTAMLFRKLLSCLVVVAYHIYHKDMVSQKNLLAACFSKLMTDNILPNAKNVKGFLFKQPGFAVVSVNYLNKCWEIYQAYCKVNAAPRDDQTMTCRHMLWMFKDLRLLDNNLTTERLLEIITAESRDPSNLSSNVDLEITFLEFFDVLLSSAEVKCQRVSEGLEEGQLLSSPDAGSRRDIPEVTAPVNSSITPEISSPKSVEDMESQQDVKTKLAEEPQSAEHTSERKCVQTRGMEVKDRKLELWIQTIHQFFNHFFFPAFEHNQRVSTNMKEEKLRQEAQRRIALAKAQQRSRGGMVSDTS
ncbi:radial spoke head 10 homolog B isoform X2 [Dicentrarchus labrax]|uniref:radial spoke head 10 homolog B isoform X2 n=1 Tax=Dicentrarchus labrax TaxID=13489 RepID=UPI0021F551AE|nr:radial spoke head 10 homolog B isoform X2 [Dicentrarchus labrax]